MLYNMLHNYMFRPFLDHLQIVPEDGIKRAETCSFVTYCTTQYNKFCCVSTASYIFCI